MKNLKIIFIIIFIINLTSCSSEHDLIETETVNNLEEDNIYGINQDAIVYSDKYCDKFNYFHNEIKLTDPVIINKMLKTAINVYHEEENINIVLSDNEEKHFLMKNKQFVLNDTTSTNSRNRNEKVYFHLRYTKVYPIHTVTRMHGGGSKHYGKFRPMVLHFGNLTDVTKIVKTFKDVNGTGVVYNTFFLAKNKMFSLYPGTNNKVYAHSIN